MNVVTRRSTPDEKYAQVNKVWQGQAAVVIGCGPSLTIAQVEMCRGLKCIAVNDAYLVAPFAEVCYFADSKWWGWQVDGRQGKGHPLGLTAAQLKQRWHDFAGIKVSIENAMPVVKDALFLRNANSKGTAGSLSQDCTAIATGNNSAYQALNIAILAGAARVILIGVDGKASDRKHFFGDHPDKSEAPYAGMKQHFSNAARELAGKVDVVNCSPGTAIDQFRLAKLEDELAQSVEPDPAATVL